MNSSGVRRHTSAKTVPWEQPPSRGLSLIIVIDSGESRDQQNIQGITLGRHLNGTVLLMKSYKSSNQLGKYPGAQLLYCAAHWFSEAVVINYHELGG